MLFIHPALQLLATIGGIYVLFLGSGRFLSLHLKRQTPFNRKRHVRFGQAVILTWTVGALLGAFMVRLYWRGLLISGLHWRLAAVMLILILFQGITGYYLSKKPRKRTILPLIHGLNGLILVLIALAQIATGWQNIKMFILGI